MIFKGTVTKSTPEVGGTTKDGKSWVKRDFVIEETEGTYPNSVVVTNFNNKVEIKEGDNGVFHINSRVNEYNGKFYNSLNLWKMEVEGVATAQASVQNNSAHSEPEPIVSEGNFDEGLPF